MPSPKELTGQRFGKLVVVERMPVIHGVSRGRRWACACDCGRERIVVSNELTSGKMDSCVECSQLEAAVAQRINVAGMRFGILTAVKLDRISGQGAHWLFKCDCGTEKVARLKDVRYGNTASCGCLKPGAPGNAGKKRTPVLDINRPWRKDEHVDDRWLVLIGERCPPGAGA